MRIQIVPADTLSTATLRARDYVFSPEREADRLIQEWMDHNPGFMHRATPAMKDLRARLVAKLEAAMASNAQKA